MRLSRYRRVFAVWCGVLQLLLAGRVFALEPVESGPYETLCGPSATHRAPAGRSTRTRPATPSDHHGTSRHVGSTCHAGAVCCAPVAAASALAVAGVTIRLISSATRGVPAAYTDRAPRRFAQPPAHAPPRCGELAG